MKLRYWIGMMVLALAIAGCGGKKANSTDAEKKVGDTEKQLQEAKGQPGAEQKVADLEKQLADAKKELAQAKEQAAAQPAPAAAPAEPPPPPPPPKPIEYVIPAGTPVGVRTTTTLSTKTVQTGAPFDASLTDPITVDGEVLAKAGAPVSGVVVLSDPGGKVKGKASIKIAIRSIRGTHGPIAIETGTAMATKGPPAEIPAETVLTFRTRTPVTVTVQP